jgi:hypothetical protein
LLSCTWLWSCWNDLNNNNNNTLSLEKRKEGRKARKAERMIQNWLLRYKTKKQTKFLTTSSHFQARAPKLFLPPLPPPTHTPWKTLLHTWWILSSDFIAGSWGQLVVNLCTQKKPRHILQQWFFFFLVLWVKKVFSEQFSERAIPPAVRMWPCTFKIGWRKVKICGFSSATILLAAQHASSNSLLAESGKEGTLTHSLTHSSLINMMMIYLTHSLTTAPCSSWLLQVVCYQ